MPIIPEKARFVSLEEAAANFPGGFVLYCRTSGFGSRKRAALDAQADSVVAAVEKVAPGRIREVVKAHGEISKVTGTLAEIRKARHHLEEASEYAEAEGCALVAADVSRFLRSAAYDRKTNTTATPTPAELMRFWKLTRGVPLVTVADPNLSESERQSLAVKRGKPGRPTSLNSKKLVKIFNELGHWDGKRWEKPLRKVAKKHGTTPSRITEYADKPIEPGKSLTWRQHAECEDLENLVNPYSSRRVRKRKFKPDAQELLDTYAAYDPSELRQYLGEQEYQELVSSGFFDRPRHGAFDAEQPRGRGGKFVKVRADEE